MMTRRGGVKADQTIEEMAKLKRAWSIEALRNLKRALTDEERLAIAAMLENDTDGKPSVRVTKKQFQVEAVFFWTKLNSRKKRGMRWTPDQRSVAAEAAIQLAERRHPSKKGELDHARLFKLVNQSLNKRVKNKNDVTARLEPRNASTRKHLELNNPMEGFFGIPPDVYKAMIDSKIASQIVARWPLAGGKKSLSLHKR